MPLFAIIRNDDAKNNEAFSSTLSKKYRSDDIYRIGKGRWLVASNLETARELSEELGIVQGKPYNGTLVLKVTNYFGLHNRKLWDWMRAKRREE